MKQTLVAMFVATVSVPALAHDGPRVYVDSVGGKLTTFAGPITTPNTTNVSGDPSLSPSKVFVLPSSYAEPLVGLYEMEFPGSTAVSKALFAQSSQVSFRLTDGLKVWNGSTFVDPGVVQFGLSKSTSPAFAIVTDDDGMSSPQAFWAVNNAGTSLPHSHVVYSLLGDGSTHSEGPDGIYMLTLQLSADGFTSSDPYHLVFEVNRFEGIHTGDFPHATADLNAAVAVLPEPTSLAMLGLAGLAMLRRKRR